MLRRRGHAERERITKRRLLRRVAVVAVLVAGIAAAVVIAALEERRQEAEEARLETEAARQQTTEALGEVLRLADTKKVRDLLDEADELWPLVPDAESAMADWLARADKLLAQRAEHEGARDRLRAKRVPGSAKERPRFASSEDAWMHQVVSDLLDGLARIPDLQRNIEARRAFVRDLRARSIEAHRDDWDDVCRAVKSPRYGWLEMRPQVGLVPLGRDPDSELFEFAHVGSGRIPDRGSDGRLERRDDTALVLVLIPGGTFQMGARRVATAGPNDDPAADNDEAPVHQVTLSPFFLSKYECTQAQWATMTSASHPSRYRANETASGQTVTLRNPVEQVSYVECMQVLHRHRLVLPTEAQWEYAARAGVEMPWLTGRGTQDLGTVANIADRYLKENGGSPGWDYSVEVYDGFGVHAPVGSLAPNTFGLHDVLGNVWEWCRDMHAWYGANAVVDPLVDRDGDRVARGGSWAHGASSARLSTRVGSDPQKRDDSVGVRPAAALRPE